CSRIFPRAGPAGTASRFTARSRRATSAVPCRPVACTQPTATCAISCASCRSERPSSFDRKHRFQAEERAVPLDFALEVCAFDPARRGDLDLDSSRGLLPFPQPRCYSVDEQETNAGRTFVPPAPMRGDLLANAFRDEVL